MRVRPAAGLEGSLRAPGDWQGRTWSADPGGASQASAGAVQVLFHGWLAGRHDGAPSPAARLAAAWAGRRAELLATLDGLYAFAVWDGRSLWLGCDRSGLTHLYVDRSQPGCVHVASHLPTLLARRGGRPLLARGALHEYLRLGDVAAPATCWEGIESLPAGTLLCIGADGEEHTPPADAPAAPPDCFDDALHRAGELLDRAVADRLHGARRPALFLSGGIDSALIAASAARLRPDTVALSIGFGQAPFDEAGRAAAIAAHLGLAHRVLRFGDEALTDAFHTMGRAFEQPSADPANPVTLLAFEAARAGHDVVLDGTGADEALGMMPPRHVRLAVQWVAPMPAALRRTGLALLRRSPWAGYAPIVDFEHPADTMVRWQGFTRPEIETLCGETVSLDHTRFFRTFSSHARTAHFQRYSALLDAMPCERLTQASIATGLVPRYPFAGSALDAFLRGLPQAQRWREGEPKRILRALLAARVPRALWDQPKHGLDFPLEAFLRGGGRPLVTRLLDPARWTADGVLRPEAVAALARRWQAGEGGLLFRTWRLLVLRGWLDARAAEGRA